MKDKPNPRQLIIFASFLTLLSILAVVTTGLADVLPTNVRMQKIIDSVVKEKNVKLIGIGSWISGKGFDDPLKNGKSDFDLRPLLEGKVNKKQALGHWQSVRSDITKKIMTEFGEKDGPKILAKVNLYPPSQLMIGVENLGDARLRYVNLNMVPNLGFNGAVTPQTPAKYAEGLYGEGARMWTDDYERSAGRLFYKSGNNVYHGMTDLTHYGEILEEELGKNPGSIGSGEVRAFVTPARKVTVSGLSNTAGQWLDHMEVELADGNGNKVAKYLDRFNKDLAAAKSRAGIDMDMGWRTEISELSKTLKEQPSNLAELKGQIIEIANRGRMESGLLRQYDRIGTASGKKILAEAIADIGRRGKLVKILTEAGGAALEHTLNAITIYIQLRESTNYAAEEDFYKAYNAAYIGALGIVNLPAGLLAQVGAWTLEKSIDVGCDLAARRQDAWDLMEGIYTAGGNVEADFTRTYSLDDLVAHIRDEERLSAVVFAKARLAAARMFGVDNDKVDEKIANDIYKDNYPIILAAWKTKRQMLQNEFVDLIEQIEETPLLIIYKPTPAELPEKGSVSSSAYLETKDQKLEQRLKRMKQILDILIGKNTYVNVYYKWDGGKEKAMAWERNYDFNAPGTYPATATMEINAGAANLPWESPLSQRISVKAGVDIDVVSKEKDSIYVTSNTNKDILKSIYLPVSEATFTAHVQGVKSEAVTCKFTIDPKYAKTKYAGILQVEVKDKEFKLKVIGDEDDDFNFNGVLEIRSIEKPAIYINLPIAVDLGGCVAHGTLVTLANGIKAPIESMFEGERIIAYDEDKRARTEAEIEKVLKHEKSKFLICNLKTQKGHELFITGNHPILTSTEEWKMVNELKPGDEIRIFNLTSNSMETEKVAVIIRDVREDTVVYNLKTTKGNYIAGDVIIHNKCLRSGSLIDTPSGQRAIESIKPGDLVIGYKEGIAKPVKVLNSYMKQTILKELPGRLIAPELAVTDNHIVNLQGRFVKAAESNYPPIGIEGAVYDLQTESGNYISNGVLLIGGE